MTGVWAWAENELATFLLLLLSGSLNKTDEPRIWTGYSKSTGSILRTSVKPGQRSSTQRWSGLGGWWPANDKPGFGALSITMVSAKCAQLSLTYFAKTALAGGHTRH